MPKQVVVKKPASKATGVQVAVEKKAPTLPPVQNVVQLTAQLSATRKKMQEHIAAEAKYAKQKSEQEKEKKEKLGELLEELFAGMAAVYPYAQEHRAELLPVGMKSVEYPDGVLRWRDVPGTLSVQKDKDEDILALLKRLDLEKYIKSYLVEEIDLDAMRADFDKITKLALDGIDIVPPGENFALVPTGSPSYLSTRVGSGKITYEAPAKKKSPKKKD